MTKFVKIDNYYVGSKINKKYYFMQIETLSEICQNENENHLISIFNLEDDNTKIELCESLETDFLLYQDDIDLTEVRHQLIKKYNEVLKNEY